jgi:tRNA pseudouridine55 synthase
MERISNDTNFNEGAILLIDKPLDWTSFDVVNKIRWKLQRQLKHKNIKVGHAGTLDPKATGLVILCTGKATKKIDEIQTTDKEYIATIKLGATTPSYDLESEENQVFPTNHITLSLIEEALNTFLGETDQTPPIFSAIKINGKRAFDYARKGKQPEMKPRKIFIHQIEVINFSMPELILRIKCSKGTYIRSIAKDIGEKLNSGAYLIGLRRTAIGENTIENALTIEKIEEILDSLKPLC